MKLNEFLPLSELLVNEPIEKIDLGETNLKEAEEMILKFIYKVGYKMLDPVVRCR